MAKETFLYEAPPLTIDGHDLSAAVYGHMDGRRHVYFNEPGTDSTAIDLQGDATRLGYRVFDEGAMFLGMLVSKDQRGHGVGERILEYFFDNELEEDVPLMPTATMHKPLIARGLKRIGLEPIEPGMEVEILPRSVLDASHVPKVNVLDVACPEEVIVDHSVAGLFYEVVPQAEVNRVYPITTADSIVTLHAQYST